MDSSQFIFILSSILSSRSDNVLPIFFWVSSFKGFGMSLVHVNSFPMVVELCTGKKVGKFTGFYYASSMAAQTITPCLLGLLLLIPNFSFSILPIYAAICCAVSLVVFIFVKNSYNVSIMSSNVLFNSINNIIIGNS